MIELSDVIRDLRSQLGRAIEAAADEELELELGDIELELTVALEKGGGGTAKVKFWVLELGGNGKMGQTDTQQLKLTLKPRLRSTGRSPHVSGSAVAGER
ncbi:trypco2 family protein [Kitasatospora sp. NPDC096140]|uniref:trypco2 family protein n=1 Tax=unclassified Kitasatospora TaxID=2633591 RepID=UPI003326830E